MSYNSSSNYRRNKAFIDQYRKELKGMLDDISDIDIKLLNKAVNKGVEIAKENTHSTEGGNIVEFYTREGKHVKFTISKPLVGGKMKEAWYSKRANKTSQGVEKEMGNTIDYSSYVNYGHRIVQGGKTKGWVPGQFMLEKAISKAEKTMKQEFEKEVERVNREHDK